MTNYIITSALAILIGQLTGHLSRVFFSIVEFDDELKRFFPALKCKFKFDYKYSIALVILYCAIIYFVGISAQAIIYFAAIPFLLIVVAIDYKLQLIPDTIQIILALIGIVNITLNYTEWLDLLMGGLFGAGTFGLLGLIGKLIYKKEGMGFGDVKLMGTLGLIFGLKGIIAVTLVAFFTGAVISIILMILHAKDGESYIPFGPFIVIGAILVMLFVPETFFDMFMTMCTWLSEYMIKFVNLIKGV